MIEPVHDGARVPRERGERAGRAALIRVEADRPVVRRGRERGAADLHEQEVPADVIGVPRHLVLVARRDARDGFRRRAVHQLGHAEDQVVEQQGVVGDGRAHVGTNEVERVGDGRVDHRERARRGSRVGRPARCSSRSRARWWLRPRPPEARRDGGHSRRPGFDKWRHLSEASRRPRERVRDAREARREHVGVHLPGAAKGLLQRVLKGVHRREEDPALKRTREVPVPVNLNTTRTV